MTLVCWPKAFPSKPKGGLKAPSSFWKQHGLHSKHIRAKAGLDAIVNLWYCHSNCVIHSWRFILYFFSSKVNSKTKIKQIVHVMYSGNHYNRGNKQYLEHPERLMALDNFKFCSITMLGKRSFIYTQFLSFWRSNFKSKRPPSLSLFLSLSLSLPASYPTNRLRMPWSPDVSVCVSAMKSQKNMMLRNCSSKRCRLPQPVLRPQLKAKLTVSFKAL